MVITSGGWTVLGDERTVTRLICIVTKVLTIHHRRCKVKLKIFLSMP